MTTPLVQLKCASCDHKEELHKKEEEDRGIKNENLQGKPIFDSNAEKNEPAIQRKCSACEQEEKVQRKEGEGHKEKDNSYLEEGLISTSGSGSLLPHNMKQQMEWSIGADFSKVRIHNDSQSAQMSNYLNAQAFTHGNDIYFNSGKYDTTNSEGRHLLAHELTHTLHLGV